MKAVLVWLLVGIPTLTIGLALFLRRSPMRAMLGYMTLAAGFVVVSIFHRPSGAVIGGLLALLYAAGRGGAMERRNPRADEEGVPDTALYPSRRLTEGPDEHEVKAG